MPPVPSPPPAPSPRTAPPADPAAFACPNQPGKTARPGPDGRLLGHLPYADAAAADLMAPPDGFGTRGCTRLHAGAARALEDMIAAARAQDPALADALVGLSCFRSIRRQKEVFCSKPGLSLAERARSSAPPGFSEHHTGYAIDFGDRTRPDCDLQACFADTPVGRWLAANAPAFGFTLSFPEGNPQGITYEPWHWRYQGSDAAAQAFGAATRLAGQ